MEQAGVDHRLSGVIGDVFAADGDIHAMGDSISRMVDVCREVFNDESSSLPAKSIAVWLALGLTSVRKPCLSAMGFHVDRYERGCPHCEEHRCHCSSCPLLVADPYPMCCDGLVSDWEVVSEEVRHKAAFRVVLFLLRRLDWPLPEIRGSE